MQINYVIYCESIEDKLKVKDSRNYFDF